MSVSMYPAIPNVKDLGSEDLRWFRLYFSYFVDGWAYRRASDFISKEEDLFMDPNGERTYVVARNRKYFGAVIGGELPPALGYNLYMGVVDGEWGSLAPDYTLPNVGFDDEWLKVVRGRWASGEVHVVSPPTPYDIDEGYMLAVLDGKWVKYDGDNFYLPAVMIITEGVRHVVTVSGYRWIKRPIDKVTGHRDGTVVLSGNSTETLRGDGTWDNGSGDDHGQHEVGDIRTYSRVGAAGYLPCDGKSMGSKGHYHDARYAPLFYHLAPPNVEWDTGLVYLPDMPGCEIMHASTSTHPVNIVMPVGRTSGAPYKLKVYASPGFPPVYAAEQPGVEWFEKDDMVFCDFGGKTIENYAGFAESISQPIAVPQGYYFVDIIDKDGTVRTETLSVTEEDIMRMDTAVVAGNYPSGCGPRAAAYRYQLAIVNGRPLHSPFYRESYGATGTAVEKTAAPGSLNGASMFVYGFGDYTAPYASSPDRTITQILRQLRYLDTPNDFRDPPKFRRVPVPFALGRGSFWGGCLGRDGKLYFCPHNAEFVLVVDPKTGNMSRWGNLGRTKFKWAGGVATNDGRIIFIPFDATDFLVLDLVTRTMSRTDFGLGYGALDRVRFVGATLTTDNHLHAVSMTGYKELDVDLRTNRAKLYDLTMAMREVRYTIDKVTFWLKYEHNVKFYKNPEYNRRLQWNPDANENPCAMTTSVFDDGMNMGYDRIDLPFLPTNSEFGGTFLHASGSFGAVPCGHWMLAFGKKREAPLPITPAGLEHLWDYERKNVPMKQNLLYWSMFDQTWGGPGNETGGRAHGIPGDTATMISDVYRCADYDFTDTAHVPPPWYEYFIRSDDRSLSNDRVKYLGGVMAADGCNYLLPCGGYHPTVMVVGSAPTLYKDNLPMTSFRVSEPRYLNCRGGALGPDGYIYSAAADGSVFFALNPRTRRVITVETGLPAMHREQTAWMGVVAGPDGWMYYPPFDSGELLIVDPCVFCGEWPSEVSNYINKF